MRKITSALNVALNLLTLHFSANGSNFVSLTAFRAIFIHISLRMRRNSYLGTSSQKYDAGVRFLDPDFLIQNDISAI